MPEARQAVYRPLMSPAEFSQLMTAIWAIRPRQFLEWGSGGSTQTILAQCPFIERYVSIEHDAGWHDRVKLAVGDPRLDLHLVEPTRPEPPRRILNATKPKRNRYRLESEVDDTLFADYVRFPLQFGQVFDFVLVDGRARRFCMPVGWELLAPGGIMAIHDAQRSIYHPVIESLGEPLFLEPWERGQICILRKPPATEEAQSAVARVAKGAR